MFSEAELMIPNDHDKEIKRNLRHRFFLEGDLDFVDNTIENSPAEETSIYFHLMWILLLWKKS